MGANHAGRRFDDLMLGSIQLFSLCAQLQSFTAAAVAAGLTPSAVSRAVSRLEMRLGVKLLSRTTRSVRLTEAGRIYHDQCRQALQQLAEAERELTGQQVVAQGKLRISVPTSYGHLFVLPLLADFRARYPDVSLEVDVSNPNIDFATGGFDLAIRGSSAQPDSGLVARPLRPAELVVVAVPAYLARHGVPTRLEALADHDCVQFLHPRTGQPVPWLFNVGGRDIEVSTQGGISCSDDVLGAVTVARHGGGLLQTLRAAVAPDIAHGHLTELLPQFAGRGRPFSLIYPSDRHMPLRMRVLIDHLVSRLGSGATVRPPASRSAKP